MVQVKKEILTFTQLQLSALERGVFGETDGGGGAE